MDLCMHLGELKSLLHGKFRLLSQLRRRIYEMNHCQSRSVTIRSKCVWKSIISDSLTDSYCLLKKGLVIQVSSVSKDKISGYELVLLRDEKGDFQNFYETPCNSTDLGIYIYKQMLPKQKIWHTNSYPLAVKCLSMNYRKCQ